MADAQQDIDALLAEVSELAGTAVAEIAGPDAAAEEAPETGSAAEIETAPRTRSQLPPHITPRIPGSQVASAPANSMHRILRLEVPVIVQLAERTMPLSEILNLTSGAIIEFEKSADSELDLMINNKCIGRGQAVKVGENFGLRVTVTGSLRDRIQALGG